MKENNIYIYIYQFEKFQFPVNRAFAIEQRENVKKNREKGPSAAGLEVVVHREKVALFQSNKECSFPKEFLTNI